MQNQTQFIQLFRCKIIILIHKTEHNQVESTRETNQVDTQKIGIEHDQLCHSVTGSIQIQGQTRQDTP